MQVTGVSSDVIFRAADTVGVKVIQLRMSEGQPNKWRFVLKPKEEDTKYCVKDKKNNRLLQIVNRYGHRDFIKTLFSLAPEAIVKTALDTYDGAEDFEGRWHESGGKKLSIGITPIDAALGKN